MFEVFQAETSEPEEAHEAMLLLKDFVCWRSGILDHYQLVCTRAECLSCVV